jgi:hypothetical protein
MDTLFTLDAGRIGNYRCCTFRCEGVGTFFPEDDAAPAVGKRNMLSEVQESRIEIIVAKGDLPTVVDAWKTFIHMKPWPMMYTHSRPGIIRPVGPGGQAVLSNDAGRLFRPVEIRVEPVDGKGGRQAGLGDRDGRGLLRERLQPDECSHRFGCPGYVSGDLGYHTARDAQQAGIGLIDIGHFGSEHLVVDVLAASIRDAVKASGLTITVEAADTETDPFHYL